GTCRACRALGSSSPRPPGRASPGPPGATSGHRAPRAPRSRALPAPARAGGRRARPRAARARPDLYRLPVLGARVGVVVDLLQPVAREVRVHLRRRDVGVAEHLLHRAQIATVREQVRGEAVPEGVRAHLAIEPDRPRVALDDLVEALAGEGPAAE